MILEIKLYFKADKDMPNLHVYYQASIISFGICTNEVINLNLLDYR